MTSCMRPSRTLDKPALLVACFLSPDITKKSTSLRDACSPRDQPESRYRYTAFAVHCDGQEYRVSEPFGPFWKFSPKECHCPDAPQRDRHQLHCDPLKRRNVRVFWRGFYSDTLPLLPPG